MVLGLSPLGAFVTWRERKRARPGLEGMGGGFGEVAKSVNTSNTIKNAGQEALPALPCLEASLGVPSIMVTPSPSPTPPPSQPQTPVMTACESEQDDDDVSPVSLACFQPPSTPCRPWNADSNNGPNEASSPTSTASSDTFESAVDADTVGGSPVAMCHSPPTPRRLWPEPPSPSPARSLVRGKIIIPARKASLSQLSMTPISPASLPSTPGGTPGSVGSRSGWNSLGPASGAYFSLSPESQSPRTPASCPESPTATGPAPATPPSKQSTLGPRSRSRPSTPTPSPSPSPSPSPLRLRPGMRRTPSSPTISLRSLSPGATRPPLRRAPSSPTLSLAPSVSRVSVLAPSLTPSLALRRAASAVSLASLRLPRADSPAPTPIAEMSFGRVVVVCTGAGDGGRGLCVGYLPILRASSAAWESLLANWTEAANEMVLDEDVGAVQLCLTFLSTSSPPLLAPGTTSPSPSDTAGAWARRLRKPGASDGASGTQTRPAPPARYTAADLLAITGVFERHGMRAHVRAMLTAHVDAHAGRLYARAALGGWEAGRDVLRLAVASRSVKLMRRVLDLDSGLGGAMTIATALNDSATPRRPSLASALALATQTQTPTQTLRRASSAGILTKADSPTASSLRAPSLLRPRRSIPFLGRFYDKSFGQRISDLIYFVERARAECAASSRDREGIARLQVAFPEDPNVVWFYWRGDEDNVVPIHVEL